MFWLFFSSCFVFQKVWLLKMSGFFSNTLWIPFKLQPQLCGSKSNSLYDCSCSRCQGNVTFLFLCDFFNSFFYFLFCHRGALFYRDLLYEEYLFCLFVDKNILPDPVRIRPVLDYHLNIIQVPYQTAKWSLCLFLVFFFVIFLRERPTLTRYLFCTGWWWACCVHFMNMSSVCVKQFKQCIDHTKIQIASMHCVVVAVPDETLWEKSLVKSVVISPNCGPRFHWDTSSDNWFRTGDQRQPASKYWQGQKFRKERLSDCCRHVKTDIVQSDTGCDQDRIRPILNPSAIIKSGFNLWQNFFFLGWLHKGQVVHVNKHSWCQIPEGQALA